MTNLQLFGRYEHARERYQEIQDDMAKFLARFTSGTSHNEETFTIRDLAYLVGIRTERDVAFADFYKFEAELFRLLTNQILPDPK